MTAKRFELCEINCFDYGVEVFNELMDNGVPLSQKRVCELLNELAEENDKLNMELEGIMGLLKSYQKTVKHDAKLLADATKNGYLPPLEDWEEL